MAQTQALPGAPVAPFALPFIKPFNAASRGQQPRRYWAPPRARSYEQASDIGRESARQLVAWLRDNRSPSGQALLIWTLDDLYAGRPTPIECGYRAGFAAHLAIALSGAQGA